MRRKANDDDDAAPLQVPKRIQSRPMSKEANVGADDEVTVPTDVSATTETPPESKVVSLAKE
jgi:hypothetical protein